MIAAAVVAATAPALAADWVKVSEMFDGSNVYYVDPGSIRIKNNMRKAWVLVDRKSPAKTSKDQEKPYKSYKALQEFDCYDNQDRYLQATYYKERMGRGNVIDAVTTPTDWVFPAPDSVNEAIHKYVCSADRAPG